MITIPGYTNKTELYEYLRESKNLIRKEKMSEMKRADGIGHVIVDMDQEKGTATKAIGNLAIVDTDTYSATVVINACSMMDSHLDVHIPGLWKKSVKETKSGLFLQEHIMKLANVISEQVQVYTAMMSWKDLGFNYPGDTEVLINAFVAQKKRNEFMANQYANGWVSEHSVGMNYVNYFLCMNSESKWDAEEKANWDKYYPMVINKAMADEYGFFFAVTEAKYREGSAVVRGACPATPPISIEPGDSTQGEQKQLGEPPLALDYDKLIKAFKTN